MVVALPSSPQVAYNARLAETWFAANPTISPTYPIVTKQLEIVPFDRRALRPFAYNPSICRWGKRILMAYRWHPDGSWRTRLAMAELDSKFKVISNKEISLGSVFSCEDSHLFVHQDKLWMSWVESASLGRCVVKYGLLKEDPKWEVPTPFQPKYGHNDGTAMEKGWVPHIQKGEIHFIYSSMPKHIVIGVNGDKVISEPTTQPLKHWPWGQVKGGTAWLENGGNAIRFFHSTLDNENSTAINNPNRRYYVSAATPTELSSRPILYGSELSDLTPTEMQSCKHYKGNVVFCSGAIAMDDGSFVLSVGINDCQTALLRVTENDLHLS